MQEIFNVASEAEKQESKGDSFMEGDGPRIPEGFGDTADLPSEIPEIVDDAELPKDIFERKEEAELPDLLDDGEDDKSLPDNINEDEGDSELPDEVLDGENDREIIGDSPNNGIVENDDVNIDEVEFEPDHEANDSEYSSGMEDENATANDEEFEHRYDRPTGWRTGMRDQVWDNAKDEHGRVRDPVSGKYMSKDSPWDMGHKPGYEFKKHQESARERTVSREQFLDEYYNSDHYRPELPSSNRSHKGEDVTDNYFGD